MHNILIGLHVIVALFLVLVVLLQTGKGAAMGSAFGGAGSQALFGASGGSNFLTKLTTGAAVIFMMTSMSLTALSAGKKSTSIIPESEQTLPSTSDSDLPLLPEEIPDGTDSSEPVSPLASEQTADDVTPSGTAPNPLEDGQPDSSSTP